MTTQGKCPTYTLRAGPVHALTLLRSFREADCQQLTLNAIICRQFVIQAVHKVTIPKAQVIVGKNSLGPNLRTAMVDGSWNTIEEIVKMNILTLYRLPCRSRSSRIDVTLADEMIPLSSKLREQRMAAIEHNRRSILRRSRFSSLRSIFELTSTLWSSSSSIS